MISLLLTLFAAGMLTILLPCILPLLPVVLGVSVSDRNRWRPLGTVLGMVISFVGFTFLLQVALNQFVTLADVLRIGTYQVLFLFGVAFALHNRALQLILAALSGIFFWSYGAPGVLASAVFGVAAMYLGGYVAARIQQLGANLQQEARGRFGSSPFLSALLIGLTLGLVWVPCAGPALGFALALVRDEPGIKAFGYLLAYALGTAVPLLLVGYGGQWAVHSVRSIAAYSGRIKSVAGFVLIATAFALHYGWLERAQTYLVQNTSYGSFADSLEKSLFQPENDPSPSSMNQSSLPKLSRAPELSGLGSWHNSQPFTMADLKGKVVLVDFWTYSCINCIRTLPYIQGYWDKYKDKPFVLLGVHAPEFTFEKSEENVKDAIERHGLTYPVAQDNDFSTWRAFANRYWPAKYLIDANGYIRYTHFGEGAYEETDNAIAALLAEAGADVSGMPAVEEPAKPTSLGRGQSPETYLGSRSWPALGNAQGEPSEDVVEYEAPAAMSLHKYYLDGLWQLIDEEYQLLVGEAGEIRMKFLGGEANLVLGLADGVKPVAAEVWIDGKKSSSFTVDRNDLYNLYKGPYGEHDLVLKLKGHGVQAFAFTFGQ